MRIPTENSEDNTATPSHFDVKIDLKKLYNDIMEKSELSIDTSIISDDSPYEIYIGLPTIKSMSETKYSTETDAIDLSDLAQYIKENL